MRATRRSNSSLMKEVDWQSRCLAAEAECVQMREEWEREMHRKDALIRDLQAEVDRLKSGQVLTQFEGSLDLSQSHLLDLASTVPGSSTLSPGLTTTLKNSGIFRLPTKPLERIPSLGEDSTEEDQEHMFEEFFVLGLRDPDTKECKPQVLYQYPKLDYAQDSVQFKVLPDFCFPLGCTPYPLQLTSSGSALNELLYGREGLTRSSNFFMFTLKADPKPCRSWDDPNHDRGVIYCVCLLTDELLITSDGQWIYPKCFCLASFQPCFELHYQVLTSLLAMKRVRRMNVVAGGSLSSSSLGRMMSQTEAVSDEEIAMLCSYHRAAPPSAGSPLRVSLDAHFNYRYPEPWQLDTSWCCPALFSCLSPSDLLVLLSAFLLEKSIVFLSANKGLLTSCV